MINIFTRMTLMYYILHNVIHMIFMIYVQIKMYCIKHVYRKLTIMNLLKCKSFFF